MRMKLLNGQKNCSELPLCLSLSGWSRSKFSETTLDGKYDDQSSQYKGHIKAGYRAGRTKRRKEMVVTVKISPPAEDLVEITNIMLCSIVVTILQYNGIQDEFAVPVPYCDAES